MATQSKKILAKVKMVIPGGGATPAPPVGSSLGQHGVNMMDFIIHLMNRPMTARVNQLRFR